MQQVLLRLQNHGSKGKQVFHIKVRVESLKLLWDKTYLFMLSMSISLEALWGSGLKKRQFAEWRNMMDKRQSLLTGCWVVIVSQASTQLVFEYFNHVTLSHSPAPWWSSDNNTVALLSSYSLRDTRLDQQVDISGPSLFKIFVNHNIEKYPD